MLKHFVRSLVLLTLIASVTVPVAARGPKGKGGSGGGSGSCATASIGLSTYTATAGVTAVGIYGPVYNCSTSKVRLTIVDTFTSACGETTVVDQGLVRFSARQSKLVSTSYSVPAGTCPGTATITRTVYGGAPLASDSANLEVLAP